MRRFPVPAFIALFLALAAPASANTFTVSSGGDAGPGTLRQAILDANANSGLDNIDFNLSGTPVTPAAPLPAITSPVVLDGTTDPNAVVDIDGTNAGALANGLTLGPGSGASTIQGLAIANFQGTGLVVQSNSNSIGNMRVGSDTSANPGGNGVGGISVSGTTNLLGGALGGLTVVDNTGAGIKLAGSDNVVSGGNTIGDFSSGNSGPGVLVTGNTNTIGGTDAFEGNTIRENGGAGVAVTGSATGNAVTANSITGNTGLGIDLGDDGVTANDGAPDGDSGPNGLQNFPVLTVFSPNAATTTVSGTLDSAPNTQFRIDLYGVGECDASGNGEADEFLGSTTVTTDGSGHASATATLNQVVSSRFIVATATSPTGSTSEFSGCLAGPPSGAVISNGTVQLGVNRSGDLNYSCVEGQDPGCPGTSAAGTGPVGLRFVPSNLDSTAPGCPCEGWGMADAGSQLSGYANESAGSANIEVNGFTSNATSATSDVTISDANVPGQQLHVVQNYHPSSASSNLYENTVTVTNTGSQAMTDLRYRRVMDWDVEPTAFSEWVTLHGDSPQLLYSSDDGFQTADPLGGRTAIDAESVCGAGYTGVCHFTDLGSGGEFGAGATGPDDHGALFDFGFGGLAVGASKTFKVYYGAADSEQHALDALTAGGAEVYSLGQSDCPNGSTIAGCDTLPANGGLLQGKPATFMFGFVTTTGDVSITKTAPATGTVGQNLTYTITVANNGPDPASGVAVHDTLPTNTTFMSADNNTCTGTTTITCALGSVANGASVPIHIVVTPTQAGPLSNTASVTTASADANQGNNSSQANTTINGAGPAISVNDVTKTEGNSGTSNATFTISLSKTDAQDVTVHYATSDGTATQPSDYTSTSGTATIPAGQTSTTVNVPVQGDTVYEANETFSVMLSSPSANASIADDQGVGTITNDDSPPTLAINDVSKTEGNAGTSNATFTVTLTGATELPATVQYATSNGSALAPGDYSAASGTLTFNPGDTTKSVNVPVVGDKLDEPDETFTVSLSSPSGATISDNQGTGTIIDDDDPPSLAIASGSVTEGNSGTTNTPLTITLSAPSAKTITVTYASADGTATAPGQYTAVGGTLTFNPGETTKTVSVPVVGDTVIELDQTLTMTLSSPSNATIASGGGTATGTIVDDDNPAVSINDVSVTEGNSGTTPATFTMTLSQASPRTVTVQYATATGSASAPADYQSASGTLTFNPGETSQPVTVQVVGDTSVESNEAFNVNLSSPSNASVGDGQGVGTIIDDDIASPPVSENNPALSINDVSVTEGNSGTTPATFTVTLSQASPRTVTVQYATATGSASAPADYHSAGGTLTFNPGQMSKPVMVQVLGDTAVESNEAFSVNLSNPSNATVSDGQGIGTIVDDDISSPPVNAGGLFCGVQHRGKCKGNPFKAAFGRPGNAVWEFGVYNPKKGEPSAKTKLLKLGVVKTQIKKAGVVTVRFALKPGAKTRRLYAKCRKQKLTSLQVKITFTDTTGAKQVRVRRFKIR